MKNKLDRGLLAASFLAAASCSSLLAQQSGLNGSFQRVLLISIDGMHSLDFANCSRAGTCPNLQRLAQTGINYLQASTPKPSDSFPGLTALVTGASPRTAGMYYDVSYDRYLAPPKKTTPYGINAGTCPGTRGTQIGFDEQADTDLTMLDGGGGINPDYLPRDPYTCAPVYPHSFLRVNTIFEVIKGNGGYTAWSDKHPSYDFVHGPSGKGVNDLWSPGNQL
jgi:Type I phosphodiesterase / nucleotide pyrophosphatase